MAYNFSCEQPGCGFESTEWPNESLRDVRAEQHMTEHETGEPMQELADFRKEYGVEI